MNSCNYWPLFPKAPRDQGLYNENIWPVFYQIKKKSALDNYYTCHWTLFPPHRNVIKIEIMELEILNHPEENMVRREVAGGGMDDPGWETRAGTYDYVQS